MLAQRRGGVLECGEAGSLETCTVSQDGDSGQSDTGSSKGRRGAHLRQQAIDSEGCHKAVGNHVPQDLRHGIAARMRIDSNWLLQ